MFVKKNRKPYKNIDHGSWSKKVFCRSRLQFQLLPILVSYHLDPVISALKRMLMRCIFPKILFIPIQNCAHRIFLLESIVFQTKGCIFLFRIRIRKLILVVYEVDKLKSLRYICCYFCASYWFLWTLIK